MSTTTHPKIDIRPLVRRAGDSKPKSLVIPGRNTPIGSLVRLCKNGGPPAPAPEQPVVAESVCPFRGVRVAGVYHRAWLRVP